MNPLKMLHFRSPAIAAIGLVLLFSACTPSAGNYFAPTAAVVNGEKIPEGDITRELRNVRAQGRSQPQYAGLFEGPDAASNRREAERQLLTGLIQRLVLAQAARRLGVSVSDSEIDQHLARLNTQFEAEGRDFDEFLKDQHYTGSAARRAIRMALLIEKVQGKIAEDTSVPDDQIRAAYEQNKVTYDAQIQIAHIQVCANFSEQSQLCTHAPEDQSLASTIAGRARAGEDFGALARQYSTDQDSAESGGVYGWIEPSERSDFEKVASSLIIGQVSDPVQTQAGWHVIKLLAKGRSFEAAREEIESTLLEQLLPEASDKFLDEALDESKIKVNPKYGRFDRRGGQVVARESAK